MDWLFTVSGFLAMGAIVGLTGVSGGSLMTPPPHPLVLIGGKLAF
jgi:hypothetical protein